MASSPDWKIYTKDKKYVASCSHLEAAAALANLYGEGTTIRYGHRMIFWTEGSETQPAGESYDHVAAIVTLRLSAWKRENRQ